MTTTEDRRFSMYIRERDNFTCQLCGEVFPPNSALLQCAHMFGRWKPSTRTDPDNACALCWECHPWMDQHPTEKAEFWILRLGETRFMQLQVRSNEVRT